MHYVRVGIDISSWTLEEKGNAVTFSVWDFAGQTVYYNTHQVVTLASHRRWHVSVAIVCLQRTTPVCFYRRVGAILAYTGFFD